MRIYVEDMVPTFVSNQGWETQNDENEDRDHETSWKISNSPTDWSTEIDDLFVFRRKKSGEDYSDDDDRVPLCASKC